jgi:hypothetical protein
MSDNSWGETCRRSGHDLHAQWWRTHLSKILAPQWWCSFMHFLQHLMVYSYAHFAIPVQQSCFTTAFCCLCKQSDFATKFPFLIIIWLVECSGEIMWGWGWRVHLHRCDSYENPVIYSSLRGDTWSGIKKELQEIWHEYISNNGGRQDWI